MGITKYISFKTTDDFEKWQLSKSVQIKLVCPIVYENAVGIFVWYQELDEESLSV